MKEKLDKINEQLDELLVKQLELIQDYITITIECESHQKTGFLNMAKARYIQGSNTVSKNCLHSEDSDTDDREAVLTVSREEALVVLETEDAESVTYHQPLLVTNPDSTLETQLSKQFGVLSSSTLKSAKSEFRKCLEKTMERASVVEQSMAIRERYKKLMKEKVDLQNTIPSP